MLEERKDISDQIKSLFKEEKLSWEKFSVLVGVSSRGSLRKKVIRLLEELNKLFSKIGYEVKLSKMQVDRDDELNKEK